MPYIVIYVESEAAANDIAFNDEHGNTQYIGDSSDETIGFHVVDILKEYRHAEHDPS